MITALTNAALKGGSCQLRSRNSRTPWNKPQSTSTCACPVSIRYFEPVTVPAAPQNERDDIVLGLVLQRKQNIGIHRTCPSGFGRRVSGRNADILSASGRSRLRS